MRHGYRVSVAEGERWVELMNTDAAAYGGSGAGNLGAVTSDAERWHGHECLIAVTVPPLGAVLPTLAPVEAATAEVVTSSSALPWPVPAL
jgi:1,4-alpha-glucan branching enzyme